MSIVKLKKVTFMGLLPDKELFLDELQRLGCVEIISLVDVESVNKFSPRKKSRAALKFLLSCPQRRHQIHAAKHFDAVAVEEKALYLQSRLAELEQESDFLKHRLYQLKPWGKFDFKSLDAMQDLRLWFYVVPYKEMEQFETVPYSWQVVNRDQRFHYVAVIANAEPENMPVERVHIGDLPPHVVAQKLEVVASAIDDMQAQRLELTQWCYLFIKNLNLLVDKAARTQASQQTLESETVFALQGWAPIKKISQLRKYAAMKQLLFSEENPNHDDTPPTLLTNPSNLNSGEDLVNFYMTPGYRTWDPSSSVFFSFSLFFAMILADAGYATLIGIGLLLFWGKLGRSKSGARYRPLLLTIVIFSCIFGILVGSYFGISPNAASFLGRLHILSIHNTKMMMALCIVIGSLHIIFANLMNAKRFNRFVDALSSIGWAGIVSGGLVYAAGGFFTLTPAKTIGLAVMVFSALLIVIFSAKEGNVFVRLVKGLMALTKVTSAFGDILSYLRLFALGLASASLASSFNTMASHIRSNVPEVGLLFALLILLFGHGLNILLGIAGGLIHGLRLNVIEFFNWGLQEDGKLFQPLNKKEQQ